MAVDLGATSGRTIIAHIADGHIVQEELTRFPNRIIHAQGHCYWDIYALYSEIIDALKLVAARHLQLTSIGIDTWGVDFVCVGADGAFLRNPLSYRDPHTEGMVDEYFAKAMSADELYSRTGIEFMSFNSLFQIYAMRRHNDAALAAASKLLFTPDALAYMLTGRMVCEYTIASTSQMINPHTRQFDPEVLSTVGLTTESFGPIVEPGTVIGELTPEVQQLTGLGAVPVVAVAGHDTASAVAVVPAADSHFAFLSSGTWSLMGVELQQPVLDDVALQRNFTNEGGADHTICLLKNICGMWLMEQCRREWADSVPRDYASLMEAAAQVEPFRSIVCPDDPMFANPPSMLRAIADYCRATGQPVPETYGEYCRCIFDSLALRYREVMQWLRSVAPFPIDVLHVIGGGSLNHQLNQATANATGTTVLAGPQECTALGNIMLQAKAANVVSTHAEMRAIVARDTDLRRYTPTDAEAWEKAYARYLEIVERKK